MAGLYRLEVDDRQLRVLLNTAKLKLSPAQLGFLGYAIRDTAERARIRVIRNVSGYPVYYDGKAFRVQVRTGALKGAIEMEWPYQGPLQARVYVNGSHTAQPFKMGDGVVKPRPVATYAAAIEYGHGPIDLKKYMMGKTVPFFASRSASSTGPFTARGLTPVTDMPGDLWENRALNNRLQAAGKRPMHFQRRRARAYTSQKKGAGSYYIAFRKVGKHGWVIPEAQPRPFMRAGTLGPAAQKDARRFTAARLVELMTPHDQPAR